MSKKVYTKTGDKGYTSLLGGQKVQKNSVRIEAYGTIDELNSFVGLLGDMINLDGGVFVNTSLRLTEIQNNLFYPILLIKYFLVAFFDQKANRCHRNRILNCYLFGIRFHN